MKAITLFSSLKERTAAEVAADVKTSIEQWLDEESEMFTVISEKRQTHRSVLRLQFFVAAITICLLCLNESPLLVGVSMAAAGYVAYMLGGGRITIKKALEDIQNIKEE